MYDVSFAKTKQNTKRLVVTLSHLLIYELCFWFEPFFQEVLKPPRSGKYAVNVIVPF
jgi:hypothetical protein